MLPLENFCLTFTTIFLGSLEILDLDDCKVAGLTPSADESMASNLADLFKVRRILCLGAFIAYSGGDYFLALKLIFGKTALLLLTV